MRSLWDRLYRSPTKQQQEVEQYQPDTSKPIKIDYVQLKQLWQKMQDAQSLPLSPTPPYPPQQIQSLLDTTHSLLQIVSTLYQQQQSINKKLQEYEKLKILVSNHSSIVRDIQQQSENALRELYQAKREIQDRMAEEIGELRAMLQDRVTEGLGLKGEIQGLRRDNQELRKQQQQNQQQIANLKQQLQSKTQKLSSLLSPPQKPNTLTHLTPLTPPLECILIYQKMRCHLYKYLCPQSLLSLSLTSKSIHYHVSRSLKTEYFPIVLQQYRQHVQQLQMDLKEHERIVDNFPTDIIQHNAIKYLFCKVKPGAYMLPFLQEQPDKHDKDHEKEKDKSKFGISSFFRKTETIKQRNYTFESLKNDPQLKQTQKRIQKFFDKLPPLTPTSLTAYMSSQQANLTQLKKSLSEVARPLQILVLSKHLYMQACELNNLVQVCFALLLQKNQENKELKTKNADFGENQAVLRRLVDGMVCDRESVEKRIFYLENEVLRVREDLIREQSELNKLKVIGSKLEQERDKLSTEVKELEQKSNKLQQTNKKWQKDWHEAITLIKQIPYFNPQ